MSNVPDKNTPPPAHAPPLCGVLTSTTAGNLAGAHLFRRYAGSLTTRTNVQGVLETARKSVVYNIGRAAGPGVGTMAPYARVERRLVATIKTNEVIATELAGMQKKYTNFTGVFNYMDLSGMTRQLAKGLAYFTVHGNLTCDHLRGGQQSMVTVLGVADDPVSASDTSVFIPRHASVVNAPGAFCAMAAAANSTGSTVFTDIVVIDEARAVQITEVTNATLALGCAHALRIILNMYNSAGYGAVAAMDIITGIHDVLSVAGHTDEGAFFRTVLRSGGCVTSYGGIFAEGVAGFMGLPMPTVNETATFTALVDTIALKSAALVALADPTTDVRGNAFPSVFESMHAIARVDAGTACAGDGGDAASLSAQIAANCGAFCSQYAKLAGWLFGVAGGDDTAARVLETKFGFLAGADDRHLRVKTAAPWFWIEPTSLFSVIPDTAAQRSGFGVVAGTEMPTTMPMFEDAHVISARGASTLIGVKMRTARTSGLMLHLHHNTLDGTANLKPLQFDKDRIAMVGGADEVIEDRRARGAGLDEYLWGRGHSTIIAPAELMYIGNAYGMVKMNFTHSDMGDITPCHMVSDVELTSGTVEVSAGRPQQMTVARIQAADRGIKRARSSAMSALTAARHAVKVGFATGGETWAVGNVEPSVRRSAVPEEIGVADIVRGEERDPGQVATHAGARVAQVVHLGADKSHHGARVVAAGGAGAARLGAPVRGAAHPPLNAGQVQAVADVIAGGAAGEERIAALAAGNMEPENHGVAGAGQVGPQAPAAV